MKTCLQIDYESLRYFEADEFDHPERMSLDFLLLLDRVRGHAGVPFRISSDWRGDSRSHDSGCAVDVLYENETELWHIVFSAQLLGIRRIGIYDEHVHLDIADRTIFLPSPRMWHGISR